MAVTPSMTTALVTTPLKLSPICAVALLRVWVTRTGIAVPLGMVTLTKAGGGGGAGWETAGAMFSPGGGGGTTLACCTGLTALSRTTGAAFCLSAFPSAALSLLGEGFRVSCGAGAGAGGGVTAAAAAGGSTVRLLTTVLTPGTLAASSAASVRAVSLLTEPFSVTTPFWTVA